MRVVLFLFVIKMAAGQLSYGNEVVPVMPGMPTITSLDVQCEKEGMTVNVQFNLPFDGVIFSKGHFSNPDCRYVDAGSDRSSYTLRIPSDRCGSSMSEYASGRGQSTRMSNTIIVQNDPAVQEVWDVARTIKCDWVDNYIKTVSFNPFSVGMLDAQEVQFQGDQPIECWMDLLQGAWPDVRDIDSVVKIGDPLSLLVYARDNNGMYDVGIKDCYAYGRPDFDSTDTPRIKLTDEEGCVLKDKLISSFYSSREKDDKGEVIVTYALVKAFKFPDLMDVYMSCNVEICKGECDNICGSTEHTSLAPPVVTTRGPIRRGSTLFGEPIYTTKPACFPGSTDPSCPQPTPEVTTPTIPTTTQPKCYPGSSDPECRVNEPEQSRPSTFVCVEGSQDPRCQQPTTPYTPKQTLAPTVPSFSCTPGSSDPRCPPPTTPAPKCYPGSSDPRCPKPTTPAPPKCYLGSSDPRCPKPTTPAPPKCYPGSSDPRCPKPTTPAPPKCYPGSSDPRCPKPTTPAPPKCYPGSSDPRCPKPTTTPAPPKCYPGSKDPRCPKPPTTRRPICYPGSPDPSCPRPPASTAKPTPRPTPKPTTKKPIRRGSTLFPATITTTRPTTPSVFPPKVPTQASVPKPSLKPTTKAPNRGKQIDSSPGQPKPEPSGKEWEGEARYHAFHSYHYQRGDGRRRRVFGTRIQRGDNRSKSRRSRSAEMMIEKIPVRLTSGVSVLAIGESLPESLLPKAEAQTSIDPLYDDPLGSVCFPLTIFAAGMLTVLFLLLISSTAALVLYIRKKDSRKDDKDLYGY